MLVNLVPVVGWPIALVLNGFAAGTRGENRYGLEPPVDREIARAYLYLMTNDLHDAPFGLLEDVYVDGAERGSGLGTALVTEVIAAAREAGCYKLIATSRTSRPKVHELCERLGFAKHGVEFRMNFPAERAST